MSTATIAQARVRAAMTTVFALAVCVVMLFWTPLEAPASWRAANQTSTTTGERF